MAEPIWITPAMVQVIHDDQVATHGGKQWVNLPIQQQCHGSIIFNGDLHHRPKYPSFYS